MREWSSLWSRLKLMVSLRAALNRRMGKETSPKVRCPFQTLDAINVPSLLDWLPAYYKGKSDVNNGCKDTYCLFPRSQTPHRAQSLAVRSEAARRAANVRM